MTARDIRIFNPSAFATLDADMWFAYYNHRFIRLFVLLLKLNYTHFQPSVVLAVRGAYHSAIAAIIFRKTKGSENTKSVLRHLEKFYKLLATHNVYTFDYKRAAELEMEWWFVDRYPVRYKITRAEALAEGMAIVYDTSVSNLAVYGQKRAAAMELLGNYHHDTATAVNWDKLRELLVESYMDLRKTSD